MFGNDKKVFEEVQKWYKKGTDTLVSRWDKAVEVDGDYVDKSGV
jgi:hypothetical protein